MGMGPFEVQACCVFTLASLRCTGNQRAPLPGCCFIYYGHSSGCPHCKKKAAKTSSTAAWLLLCQPCSALIHTAILWLREVLSLERDGGVLSATRWLYCLRLVWLIPDVYSHTMPGEMADGQPAQCYATLIICTSRCPGLVASSLTFHLCFAKWLQLLP